MCKLLSRGVLVNDYDYVIFQSFQATLIVIEAYLSSDTVDGSLSHSLQVVLNLGGSVWWFCGVSYVHNNFFNTSFLLSRMLSSDAGASKLITSRGREMSSNLQKTG